MTAESEQPTPQQKNKKSRSVFKDMLSLLGSQFDAFDPDESKHSNYPLEDSPIGGIGLGAIDAISDHVDSESNEESERDSLRQFKMPLDRASKYEMIQQIMQDPTGAEGLDIHISYALSPDSKTNRCFYLQSTAPEHDKLVAELNARLVPKISKNLAQWCKVATGFGINFVRPRCKEGIGITHFQSDYHTMPNFVRKYEKAGLLAGYTSQHLRDKDKAGVAPAPPWSLLEIKIPFFTPNINVAPTSYDGKLYSLYDDIHDQKLIEAQDYGTSFFEYSLEAFYDFKEALESLRASRRNASRIDRFITTQIDNLDPIAGAEYINLISRQLKEDMAYAESRHRKQGTKPLVNNSVMPVAGNKGGVTIDTQSTDPNIQHIEDLMLHLKRFTSSFGLDLALLGWSDSLSGGIGEGGYFQTSIQAARRAIWIRQAAEAFIMDAVDLDFWYRHRKAIPEGITKPWKVCFYAQNSAIEEQEGIERESKANYSAIVAALIDAICQGSANKSPTLKKVLLGGVLNVDDSMLDTILSELSVEEPSDEESLMSSLADLNDVEKVKFLMGRLTDDAM